jgi:hypothetical protein
VPGGVSPLKGSTDNTITEKLRKSTEEITKKIEDNLQKTLDLSDPDKLFHATRQRLMSESTRITKISLRNLIWGGAFSVAALFVLAYPMFVQPTFTPSASREEILRWGLQSYLPRFAVAILLQFVGFFFLRLYVANENDLKHNRNELTNIEAKMMALQFSQIIDDSAMKKEVVKTLLKTERNFTLKKNERIISADTTAEYNDLKSLLERIISKLPRFPGAKATHAASG